MRIRSITCFVNPRWPLDNEALKEIGALAQKARTAFETAGYTVQSIRLASTPFPYLLADLGKAPVVEFACKLEQAAQALGFDYVSLGPALPSHPESYAAIPAALAATRTVFCGGMMTSPEGISLAAVKACAEVIRQAATISPDGFANLRFAALANVPPGTPFFPAAYHMGEKPTLALAMEAADLAVEAFVQAATLAEARARLRRAIEYHAHRLNIIGCTVAHAAVIPCGGIDFSLAPFPQATRSLGEALERLGVPALGLHGSLAAAAIIADTIDQAHFVRTGFSGLMLPVLEDSTLAGRAADNHLTLTDLLLYSAVCGTGLDTIPLPGDASAEQLAAVLLDVAALAQRLDKPLTARLMPIPGKKAGDLIHFDFPYFADSRVMALRAEPPLGLLAGSETLSLTKRSREV